MRGSVDADCDVSVAVLAGAFEGLGIRPAHDTRLAARIVALVDMVALVREARCAHGDHGLV
jgi:hypothetical protein